MYSPPPPTFSLPAEPYVSRNPWIPHARFCVPHASYFVLKRETLRIRLTSQALQSANMFPLTIAVLADGADGTGLRDV